MLVTGENRAVPEGRPVPPPPKKDLAGTDFGPFRRHAIVWLFISSFTRVIQGIQVIHSCLADIEFVKSF